MLIKPIFSLVIQSYLRITSKLHTCSHTKDINNIYEETRLIEGKDNFYSGDFTTYVYTLPGKYICRKQLYTFLEKLRITGLGNNSQLKR